MSYTMLWVESLAAALLLVATAAACVARWPQRWARLAVLLAVTLPLFALTATVSVGTGFLRFDRAQKPLDPEDKDLLDYLASQERALVLLRKAAAMPNCAFEHDYSENISMLLPELDQLPRGAELLSLHAVARAGAGDLGGAL